MIYAAPSTTFTASTDSIKTGLVGTIGVRIMQGSTTVTARSTAGIVESPAGSGIYTATLTAPTNAGGYVVVWDTGGGTPSWLDEELTVTYSAQVAQVATGRDLTTVANVKALMQKTGANAGAQDALIQTLITRASVKIMRDYGREFVPGGPDSLPFTAATRTFEYAWGEQYPGEAFVDFRPYDLNVTQPVALAVIADPLEAAPYTLSTDEWRLWPYPPRSQVYLGIKVLPLNMSIGIIGWRKRYITVTGNWGFPSIPPEVAQACDETVMHWITSYPGARRVDQVDAAIAAPAPRSYPMSAVDLLGNFKRMTVG